MFNHKLFSSSETCLCLLNGTVFLFPQQDDMIDRSFATQKSDLDVRSFYKPHLEGDLGLKAHQRGAGASFVIWISLNRIFVG